MSRINNATQYEDEYLDQIRMAAEKKLPLSTLKLEDKLSPSLFVQAQEDYARAAGGAGKNVMRDLGQLGMTGAAIGLKGLEAAAKGPAKTISEDIWGKVGQYLQDPEKVGSDLQNIGNQAVVDSRMVRDPKNFIEEQPLQTLMAAAEFAAPAGKFSKIKKPANKGKTKIIGEIEEFDRESTKKSKYGPGLKDELKYDQDIEPSEIVNQLSPEEWPAVDPNNLPSGKKYREIEDDSRVRQQRLPQVDYEMPSPYQKTFIDDTNSSVSDDAMEASSGRNARIPDMSRRPGAERIRDLERARDTDWAKNPENRRRLEEKISQIRDKEGSWDDESFGMSEEISGPYARIRKPKSPQWDTMDSGEMDIGDVPNYPDDATIDVENLSPSDAEAAAIYKELAQEQYAGGGSQKPQMIAAPRKPPEGTQGTTRAPTVWERVKERLAPEKPMPAREEIMEDIILDESAPEPEEVTTEGVIVSGPMDPRLRELRGGTPQTVISDPVVKGTYQKLWESIEADLAKQKAEADPKAIARRTIAKELAEATKKPPRTPEQLSEDLRAGLDPEMIGDVTETPPKKPAHPIRLQAEEEVDAMIKDRRSPTTREERRAMVVQKVKEILQRKK